MSTEIDKAVAIKRALQTEYSSTGFVLPDGLAMRMAHAVLALPWEDASSADLHSRTEFHRGEWLALSWKDASSEDRASRLEALTQAERDALRVELARLRERIEQVAQTSETMNAARMADDRHYLKSYVHPIADDIRARLDKLEREMRVNLRECRGARGVDVGENPDAACDVVGASPSDEENGR